MQYEELAAKFVTTLLPYLSAILVALLSWATAAAVRWINAKVEGERTRMIAERLIDEVGVAVTEVQQTIVDDLRASAKDGRLTKEEAMHARDAAVARAKAMLGERGRKLLEQTIQPDALDDYLRARVEAAVADSKPKG